MTTSNTTAVPGDPSSARPGVLPALAGIGRPTLGVLLGLLVLRTVLLFLGDGLTFALSRAVNPEATWDHALFWSSIVVVVVDVITIVVVALALRRLGSSLRSLLTTRTPGRDIAWGLLMAVICIVGFQVATFIGNLVAYLGPPPAADTSGYLSPSLWYGIWAITLMPITIAIAEEVLYRGYLQSALSARWGKIAGLLVTAAFFGLQHLALTSVDPQAWLARFITTFLAGIMFGLLAWWMKRLWPVIIGHWLLDVLGLGLPMLLASLGGS